MKKVVMMLLCIGQVAMTSAMHEGGVFHEAPVDQQEGPRRDPVKPKWWSFEGIGKRLNDWAAGRGKGSTSGARVPKSPVVASPPVDVVEPVSVAGESDMEIQEALKRNFIAIKAEGKQTVSFVDRIRSLVGRNSKPDPHKEYNKLTKQMHKINGKIIKLRAAIAKKNATRRGSTRIDEVNIRDLQKQLDRLVLKLTKNPEYAVEEQAFYKKLEAEDLATVISHKTDPINTPADESQVSESPSTREFNRLTGKIKDISIEINVLEKEIGAINAQFEQKLSKQLATHKGAVFGVDIDTEHTLTSYSNSERSIATRDLRRQVFELQVKLKFFKKERQKSFPKEVENELSIRMEEIRTQYEDEIKKTKKDKNAELIKNLANEHDSLVKELEGYQNV